MAEKKKQITSNRFSTALIVIVITACAAFFRLWGIKWGLPNTLHHFSYHPDEVFQVGAMVVLDPFKRQLDPGFYNYPTGYMNIGSMLLQILRGYGWQATVTSVYLVARVLTVVMGVVTVPVVYGSGSKLYSKSTGIIAASIFAVLPLHIVHSHFATVDVPATLWVAVAILGACWIISGGDIKACVVAGLATGFAAGTKYNVALVIIPVIVACFLSEKGRPYAAGRLVASVLACAVGFFVACPGFILWPQKFLNGLKFEMGHAQTGHGMVFIGKGPGWYDVLASSFGYGVGVAMLVMILAAVGMAFARRKRSDWMLLSFVIPYYVLISFSQVRFTRYALPLLPPLAILVGRMMVEVYDIAREHNWKFKRLAWAALCAITIAYTAIYATAFARLFAIPDVRDQVAEWMISSIPQKTSIGFATVPWFYSPPLTPEMTGSVRREDRLERMQGSRFDLMASVPSDWDSALITKKKPKYIVVTDFEYMDPLRLKLPDAIKFRSQLRDHYAHIKRFTKPFSAFGIDFGPTERLPHDLKYECPTIHVYRRS